MEIEYRVLTLGDAERAGLDVGWKDSYGEWEYDHAVVRVEDNCSVEIIGTDGGEPEDQTLTRDWYWVADALNEAYELGYKHGKDQVP